MKTIAQLLSKEDVLLDLEVPDKQSMFEALGRHFEQYHDIAASDVVDGLNTREKLGSTGVGQGVAIPHARVEGLCSAAAAFVRLKWPFDFEACDSGPVNYCFALLVPTQSAEQDLKILENVAVMFAREQFRHQLAAAITADDVHQLFDEWRERKSVRPRPIGSSSWLTRAVDTIFMTRTFDATESNVR